MNIEYPRMAQQFNPRVSAPLRAAPNGAARVRGDSKPFQHEHIQIALLGAGCCELSKGISRTYRHCWPAPRVHSLHGRCVLVSGAENASIVRGMQLSGLFVYPIKACAGIALERAAVVARGLALDRRYMLIDRNGSFVSQREVPRLCLVSTALEDSRLLLTAPGALPLRLPQTLDDVENERTRYRVWGDTGSALCHSAGSRWFSEFLNDDVRLVHMPESERRAVNPKRARAGDIVSFADAYPFLAISEASLADLNSRLEAPLEMRRFRPNLVLSGCEAFAEDAFKTLTIGNVSFRAVKRCDRCVVTTVDPATGERSKEPLRTLAKYRQAEGKVWFGMNLIHDGTGELCLGDNALAAD
jgi:uncharacterized protein YcbX